MRLVLKPMKAEAFEFESAPWEKVKGLKERVAASRSLPAEHLRFVHQGRVLCEASTLQELGLGDGDFVLLVPAGRPPRAPPPPPPELAASGEELLGPAAPCGSDIAAATEKAPVVAPVSPNGGAPVVEREALDLPTPLWRLRRDPMFEELARAIGRGGPQLLEQMLEALAKHDLEMANAIRDSRQTFLRLVREVGGIPESSPVEVMPAAAQTGQSGEVQRPAAPPTPPPVEEIAPEPLPPQLQPGEQAAMERFAPFGFDTSVACEAHIASGKDEEVAASYLFEDQDGAVDVGVAASRAEEPPDAEAGWSCFKCARHIGDDLEGSGCQAEIDEAVQYAEESLNCVGFTLDYCVLPPLVWFHSAILPEDYLADSAYLGFELYVHRERFAASRQACFRDSLLPPELSPEDEATVQRLVALGFSAREALEAYLACDRNGERAAGALFGAEAGFAD